jgi:hypothetical protein
MPTPIPIRQIGNSAQILNQHEYPNQEEILNGEINFKSKTVNTIKEWKKTNFKGWKEKQNEDQISLLKELLLQLATVYEKPVEVITDAEKYHYNPTTKTIGICHNHPSIISSLHEFAHHILGRNEKKACRWSVQLFKKVFPKAFARLSFQGHLLVKNN